MGTFLISDGLGDRKMGKTTGRRVNCFFRPPRYWRSEYLLCIWMLQLFPYWYKYFSRFAKHSNYHTITPMNSTKLLTKSSLDDLPFSVMKSLWLMKHSSCFREILCSASRHCGVTLISHRTLFWSQNVIMLMLTRRFAFILIWIQESGGGVLK